MILSLFLDKVGHHLSAWRHPGAAMEQAFTLAYNTRLAQAAEAARFDLVFLADALTLLPENNAAYTTSFQLDPIVLLSALMAGTRRVGLAATVSTTYTDPYHVARKFASLDLLSEGRAAWNVVTSMRESEARNFNLAQSLPHELRYARAQEFVEVVRKLWDSWTQDSFLIDRTSGVLADEAGIRPIHHRGDFFSVEGALNVPRRSQAHPVLVQAGASGVGKAFAARNADLVFASVPDIDAARTFTQELKQAARAAGRDPARLKVLPGFIPIVGRTLAEAREKKEALDALLLPTAAVRYLSQWLEVDLTPLDPQAPVPDEVFDIDRIKGQKGRFQNILRIAKAERLSLGALASRVAATRTHSSIVGTGETIALEMERWVAAGACDGFNILPPTLPDGFDDFAREVVPVLQQRGTFRRDYTATTLRGHLGLPDR
ncbi:LLM class flavin-dependent oxidoreductase [Pseudorhodoferax sp.]|uniref:LLM class flavin-dependent oxidoreductase n=1 Tax=Pseudorhodoferax sp. TaxID=1993553 RepID=UPI002DD6A88C|nr:LLM class flavin-dependent oxidoreductase [Pseudorhodoferax sp.]